MADLARLLELLDRPGTRAHFVGVGGAGMAPLAAMVQDRGWRVDGCDLTASPVTRQLAERGIAVADRHDAAHAAGPELIVVSSAVPADLPEVAAARAADLPVVKRALLVGALTRRARAICVAGTHGKTTTTAMAAVALLAAGADPSVLVGGVVAGIGVGGRSGGGDLLVVESDEYDGSFLNFQPRVAVLTNVEADHLDYYADRAAIDAAFAGFLRLVPPDGRIVFCRDDPGARALAPAGAVGYGFEPGADWRAEAARPNDLGGMDFLARGPDGPARPVRLAVPGRHNVLNALAALAACHAVGADLEPAIAGLAGFRGAARRFDLRGQAAGVSVYDDYSHHPTEIRAALAAARLRGQGRVWCIFQPHTFHRTRALWDEFLTAFDDADRVLLLDVYSPAGREPALPEVSARRLAEAVRHPAVEYAPSGQAAVEAVARGARPGDLVFTMGAGDVTNLAPRLLERLGAGEGPPR